jgi:hypothetical protein
VVGSHLSEEIGGGRGMINSRDNINRIASYDVTSGGPFVEVGYIFVFNLLTPVTTAHNI